MRAPAKTVGSGLHRGILAGVGAGLLWGLAFVLPDLVPGWSASTITAGRYLAYGVVSLVLFGLAAARSSAARETWRRHWAAATLFAITGNVGYYLLVVLGIQAAGAAVTTMIVGCVPVAVAVASNAADRLFPWRRLLLPVGLVLAGLVIVNGWEILSSPPGTSTTGTVWGIVAAFCGMCVWTTYGVGNARFLAARPEVGAGEWSTVVGVATGAVAVLFLPLALVTGQLGRDAGAPGSSWLGLVVVAVLLGVVVSWGGTWLWNDASTRLPTALAGTLVVVETVSGYGYGYLLRGQWPPLVQVVGFAVILAGVLCAVQRQRAGSSEEVAQEPAGATPSAEHSSSRPPATTSKVSSRAGSSPPGRET